jgi:hypothetical protein
MYVADVCSRDPASLGDARVGFLAEGLTKDNSGHSSCIGLCKNFNSISLAQSSDPSKKVSETTSLDHVSIPIIFIATTSYSDSPSGSLSSLAAYSEANSVRSHMSSVTSPSVPPSDSSPFRTGSELSVPIYNTAPIAVKKKQKKKYKPVALKVRLVIGELQDRYRIVRNIVGNPLQDLPILNPRSLPFKPCGRYTQERMELFDKNNAGFLLSEERALLHHFMMLHQDAFAWNDTERGHFREDFFPPIEIPVVPHTPWVQRNIPIPPGLYDKICKLIQRKIDAGVFEPSNSSYRSRWFTVVKKDGKSLRIVQSLEPLNEVTIQHSGVPPYTEQLVEHFAARACGSLLDLFVGYDERALAKSSRDYTTFQTPFGAMRLTTLPMGWRNSVPIFHDDVTFILRPEIPHVTQPYIDDVPVRGPATRYVLPSGEEERIPENPGIRRFVWEHFQDLNRICQRMKYSGGTFSGFKSNLCASEIELLGQRCTSEGRLPNEARVLKVKNWESCTDLSDVRAFIGTIGICRMFIKNFAHRAHHLVRLTRKGTEWVFGQDQLDAMEDLKDALINSTHFAR